MGILKKIAIIIIAIFVTGLIMGALSPYITSFLQEKLAVISTTPLFSGVYAGITSFVFVLANKIVRSIVVTLTKRVI